MVIKIDFEALIKVVLDELERQYPNKATTALKGTSIILQGKISDNSKLWFTLLGAGILAIDNRDLD